MQTPYRAYRIGYEGELVSLSVVGGMIHLRIDTQIELVRIVSQVVTKLKKNNTKGCVRN